MSSVFQETGSLTTRFCGLVSVWPGIRTRQYRERTWVDKVRNVRVAAVVALGQIGDRYALESLHGLVNDREWEVRAVLAESLGKLADKRSQHIVLGLLNDRDQEVRQNAAEALGKVGDESVLESLVMAMVDEHMGVRQASSRAIIMVDPYWDRSPVVQGMLPDLREAMKHRDTGVQTH